MEIREDKEFTICSGCDPAKTSKAGVLPAGPPAPSHTGRKHPVSQQQDPHHPEGAGDHFENSPFSYYPFPNFMSTWPQYSLECNGNTEKQPEKNASLLLFSNIYATMTRTGLLCAKFCTDRK